MSIITLDSTIKNIIINACETASILGITDISLEHNNKGIMVRGFTGDHGSPVMISHTFTNLELPFQSFAINNCKNFISRYSMADFLDKGLISQITVDDNTKKVNNIIFKNNSKDKKFNMKFNVGNADAVKAPKGITDTVILSFSIEKDHTNEISKAVKAMVADDITLISDGTELSYEIRTGTNGSDVFRSTLQQLSTTSTAFAYSYPFSILLPLLHKNDNSALNLTSRGLLNCNMNGLNVYLLPRINKKNV